VSGVSRDARSHRLRTLVADAVGVPAGAVVDVDRFGATAAVTLLPSAVPSFRSGLAAPALAKVLWEVAGAAPWSPLFLGSRRRAQMSGPAAAASAASLCRRRLEAKLAQLAGREAMPPHLRAALRAHVAGLLSRCPDGAGGPAPASNLATVGASAPHAAPLDAPPRARIAVPPTPPSALPVVARIPSSADPLAAARARSRGPRGPPAAGTDGPRLGCAERSAGGGPRPDAAAPARPRPRRRRRRPGPTAPGPPVWPAFSPAEQPRFRSATPRGRATSAPPRVAAVGPSSGAGRIPGGWPPALSRSVAQLLDAVPLLGDRSPSCMAGPDGAPPPATPAPAPDGVVAAADPATARSAPVADRARDLLARLGVRALVQLPPLPPPPRYPPRALMADTALAAEVPLPCGGVLFRPRPARAPERSRPPPPAGPTDRGPRPRTRAAVAAAAAAAAAARDASFTPTTPGQRPLLPAMATGVGAHEAFVSDECHNE